MTGRAAYRQQAPGSAQVGQIYALTNHSESRAALPAGQQIISKHLADNTLLQNYTTVLEIIMRMRMMCDHADLVTQDASQNAAQASHEAAASHPELVERLISVLKVRPLLCLFHVRDGRATVPWCCIASMMLQMTYSSIHLILKPQDPKECMHPVTPVEHITCNPSLCSHLTPPCLQLMLLLRVQAGGDEDCAVCLSEMQQPCITLCAHVFCRACIEKVMRWVSSTCARIKWTGPVSGHRTRCQAPATSLLCSP